MKSENFSFHFNRLSTCVFDFKIRRYRQSKTDGSLLFGKLILKIFIAEFKQWAILQAFIFNSINYSIIELNFLRILIVLKLNLYNIFIMKEYYIIFRQGTVVTDGEDNYIVRHHQVPDLGTHILLYNGIVDCESMTTGKYFEFIESKLTAVPGMAIVRDY